MIYQIKQDIQKAANPKKAKILQRFFKTGPGQYGEGDIFLGVTVPETRSIAKKYISLTFSEITALLESKIHEERLIALLILVEQYQKNLEKRKEIFDFYLDNIQHVNNWDLVDLSADKIVGRFLYDFGKDYPIYKILLKKLAESKNFWERRIAIIATFYFIKQNDFDETLKISKILIKDNHDLIHKAVGWMLREVGKKDQEAEENFLKKYYKIMPRTMLRYAIERFDKGKKAEYMKK